MTESEINKEAAKFFPPQRYPFGLAFSQDDVVAFAQHCVEKANGWRPIDEDAKTGKPMLVVENGVVLRACWVAKFTHELGASDFYGDEDYDEATDTSYWPEGWYEWNRHEEIHWVLESEPTAYMPLPPAPKPVCPYGDKLCPCPDGDQCHYTGTNPMKPPPEAA